MKNNKSLFEILTYPSLINPLAIVIIIFFTIGWLTTSWAKIEVVNKRLKFVITGERFKTLWQELVISAFMTNIINTFWGNESRTDAYVEYLRNKWFSPYNTEDNSDWRYDHYLESSYKNYLEIKHKNE